MLLVLFSFLPRFLWSHFPFSSTIFAPQLLLASNNRYHFYNKDYHYYRYAASLVSFRSEWWLKKNMTNMVIFLIYVSLATSAVRPKWSRYFNSEIFKHTWRKTNLMPRSVTFLPFPLRIFRYRFVSQVHTRPCAFLRCISTQRSTCLLICLFVRGAMGVSYRGSWRLVNILTCSLTFFLIFNLFNTYFSKKKINLPLNAPEQL